MTAKQFKQFLSRHGWTGCRFAKLTGIPKSTVYQWAASGVIRQADQLLVRLIDVNPDFVNPPEEV